MEKAKTVKPAESPGDPDLVSRLLRVLEEEGFKPLTEEEHWADAGERVFRREEKVLFVGGETVFILIDYPALDEKIVAQAVAGLTNFYRARTRTDKALSVFQPRTIFVCIIAQNESPHYASLNRYVTSAGGAVIVPVIIVPAINQVVYPLYDEKVGSVRPRIDYLRYVLGERREKIDMHRRTIHTFYASAAFLTILLIGAVIAMVS